MLKIILLISVCVVVALVFLVRRWYRNSGLAEMREGYDKYVARHGEYTGKK